MRYQEDTTYYLPSYINDIGTFVCFCINRGRAENILWILKFSFSYKEKVL